MGLNLYRFIADPDYRAIKRWKWARGDRNLKLPDWLGPDDAVLDIGAFDGAYAAALAARGVRRIDAFEPVPAYATLCRAEAARNPAIHVHEYGLSDRDYETEMSVEGLASSAFRQAGTQIRARFRDIAGVVAESPERAFALAKINVEGGEYEILPRLVETGLIGRIDGLLIQFHRLGADSTARHAAIAENLGRTHTLAWRYPFVWEMWRRKA